MALGETGIFDAPEWHLRARCVLQGPRTYDWVLWFFPSPGDEYQRRQVRTFCEGCAVRVECESAGMSEDHGMWGGLTARERRKKRRQQIEEAV